MAIVKTIRGIALKQGSHEEILPDFAPEFPYIASRVELDQFISRQTPWHWHKEVELFWMEQGVLEYDTPQGKILFPTGSAGFVNSNVLHTSKAADGVQPVTAYLHLFDPSLIGGHSGSAIDHKYVIPLITDPATELIGLFPDRPEHQPLLDLIRQSFALPEDGFAYEIQLRSALSQIWCELAMANPSGRKKDGNARASDKIKMMMSFIHKHCAEKFSVAEIAAAAFISERECYRIFHDCLNMTPLQYTTEYRINKACCMLTQGNETITNICFCCGLGSSSYFGKLFRERFGCSPKQYRANWQDRDRN